MRIGIAIAAIVVLGVAAGMLAAIAQVRVYPWRGVHYTGGIELNEDFSTAPSVVVDNEVHNFGVMDNQGSGYHDFLFTNEGSGPLHLSEQGTSCKCAVSKIEGGPIPPGETTYVRVEWHGKGAAIGKFRHTAAIGTNDPRRRRVELTVEGRLVPAARALPQEILISRVRADEGATGSVRIYGFLEKKLQVMGFELVNPAIADFFEVDYEEMPVEEARAAEEDATCGYIVNVHVKSGLPLGGFRQTIRLMTNLEQMESIDIPVLGSVQSDVSVVGAGWDERRGVLDLGTIQSQEGAERQLLIVVRGPHRKEVKITPVETIPDLLKVDVGPLREARDGSVTQTTLKLSVPSQSRPCNYVGPSEAHLGKIVLETTHPNASQIKILVRFAVEG
jgi:hypothetical protein